MKLNYIDIFKGLSLFLGLVVLLFLSIELRGVLISLFVAFIISSGLRPLIAYLEKRGIKRSLAILITFVSGIIITLILCIVIINVAVNQTRLFISNIDTKIETAEKFVDSSAPFLKEYIDFDMLKKSVADGKIDVRGITSSQFFSNILENISFFGGQSIGLLGRIFGGALAVFSIVMISIYMLSNRKSAYEDLIELTPERYQKRLFPLFKRFESILGAWLVGQISLMFIIGFASLVIVVLPALFNPEYPLIAYALIIAIIAGLLEAIPSIGPILTTFITVIIALISGASIGVIIYLVVAFMLLQQIEGIFIVPQVMKKAVDLNPILSIVGVLAGLQLGGPIAALLAVPVIVIIQIVILEVSTYWKEFDGKKR